MTEYEFFVSKSPKELGELFKNKITGCIEIPKSRKLLRKNFNLSKDLRLVSYSSFMNYSFEIKIKIKIFGDSVITTVGYCCSTNSNDLDYVNSDFFCTYEITDIKNKKHIYLSEVKNISKTTKLLKIISSLKEDRSNVKIYLTTIELWFNSMDIYKLIETEDPFGCCKKFLNLNIIVDILRYISPKYSLLDMIKMTIYFKYFKIEDPNLLSLLGSSFDYERSKYYYSKKFKYPSEKEIDNLLEKYDKAKKEIELLNNANREFYCIINNFKKQVSEKYGVSENLINEEYFDIKKDRIKKLKCINERLSNI